MRRKIFMTISKPCLLTIFFYLLPHLHVIVTTVYEFHPFECRMCDFLVPLFAHCMQFYAWWEGFCFITKIPQNRTVPESLLSYPLSNTVNSSGEAPKRATNKILCLSIPVRKVVRSIGMQNLEYVVLLTANWPSTQLGVFQQSGLIECLNVLLLLQCILVFGYSKSLFEDYCDNCTVEFLSVSWVVFGRVEMMYRFSCYTIVMFCIF